MGLNGSGKYQLGITRIATLERIFFCIRLACMCMYLGALFLLPSGKSTLLAALGEREVPIPDHVDIFHLSEEMPASDKTPLQCVMEVDEERYCFLRELGSLE